MKCGACRDIAEQITLIEILPIHIMIDGMVTVLMSPIM